MNLLSFALDFFTSFYLMSPKWGSHQIISSFFLIIILKVFNLKYYFSVANIQSLCYTF